MEARSPHSCALPLSAKPRAQKVVASRTASPAGTRPPQLAQVWVNAPVVRGRRRLAGEAFGLATAKSCQNRHRDYFWPASGAQSHELIINQFRGRRAEGIVRRPRATFRAVDGHSKTEVFPRLERGQEDWRTFFLDGLGCFTAERSNLPLITWIECERGRQIWASQSEATEMGRARPSMYQTMAHVATDQFLS